MEERCESLKNSERKWIIQCEISKEEAEAIVEDAEKFLVRIKDAIKEINNKSQS